MKAQSYSRTAQYMALGRAVEYTNRSPKQRILSDPWAVHFIPNPLWRTLASLPIASWLVTTFFERWLPGVHAYALARARLVDDLTRQQAQEGLDQLVLLGAGFDTTVFRLQDSLQGIRVFEVDHPATQEVKKTKLAKMRVPVSLTLVPVNFEEQDLQEQLLASGFECSRRSMITFLGVSFYLTKDAVAKTLRQAAELCSPGSRLIFDYVTETLTMGMANHAAARACVRHASQLGEPFLSGLDPDQAASYLGSFGFKLLRQYDGRDLQARYCGSGRVPIDFTRIAHCERI